MVEFALNAQQTAYVEIRDRILDGTYQGGEWLRTQSVAESLGMSRIPVREALRQLEVEGLVTMRPNRGAVVTELSPDDVSDLFELRAAVEGLAARHAVRHLSDEDLQTLERLRLRLDAVRTDVKEWMSRHEEFHRFIDRLTKRTRLTEEVARLRASVQPYMLVFNTVQGGPTLRNAEHDAVVAALGTRDPERAETCIKEHVMSAGRDVIEYLRKKQSGKPVDRERVRKTVSLVELHPH
ncbi:MAG: GntR family transcriptional regulator [Lautropia sp.]